MKHLTIVYGDMTLFDGEVAEFTWTDTGSGVRVEGKVRGSGLGELLTGLSKQSTTARVEAKRQAYQAEKVQEEVNGNA